MRALRWLHIYAPQPCPRVPNALVSRFQRSRILIITTIIRLAMTEVDTIWLPQVRVTTIITRSILEVDLLQMNHYASINAQNSLTIGDDTDSSHTLYLLRARRIAHCFPSVFEESSGPGMESQWLSHKRLHVMFAGTNFYGACGFIMGY